MAKFLQELPDQAGPYTPRSVRERQQARKRPTHPSVLAYVDRLNRQETDPAAAAHQQSCRRDAKRLLIGIARASGALAAADLAPGGAPYPSILPRVLVIAVRLGELIDLGGWEGLPVVRAPRLTPFLRIARGSRREDFRCCPECARFFFAHDDRQMSCSDSCRKVAARRAHAEKARENRPYRKVLDVKQTSRIAKRRPAKNKVTPTL
jgi:hypothetical protein